jgi:LPS-assembly lipoprotein
MLASLLSMRSRLAGLIIAGALLAIGPLVAGCGWAPLYADPQNGAAAADLSAIKVAPIPERIGQNLEIALRTAVNPSGDPTPQRYMLRVTLQVSRQNLGLTSQGYGTLGRIDVYAHYVLADLKTGAQLFAATSHFNNTFNLLANGYSNVVAQSDSEIRVVDELRDDILMRLTVFLQRRAAAPPAKI